jgi:hypothetical protein
MPSYQKVPATGLHLGIGIETCNNGGWGKLQVSEEYLLTHFSAAREPIPLGKMLGDHFIVSFNQGSDAFLQILDGSMLSLGVVTQGQKALFIHLYFEMSPLD